MKSQILIDVDSYLSSVSLLEDGCLKEHYVEYKESDRITGNIYKGRVMNVLQGMQTAFVNIGLKRNGFLFVGETLDHKSVLSSSGIMPSTLSVKEGDYVMVQVTKEEVGSKGARLSENISLPGRFVVYLPTLDFIGVSNKITDQQERERLTKLLEKVKPQGGGFIARTVCQESKKNEILDEIKVLKSMYEKMKSDFDTVGDNISLLHTEGDLIYRTVRDMLGADVDAIVCNDKDICGRLKLRFDKYNSKFKDCVQFYESDYDMAEVFGVLSEVDKLLEHKVYLKRGGSIVIDHTEALTAIDVNTGSFIGTDNHEETVFEVNMEAAVEIARQLRLRNIGGIVIVDFIDMTDDNHKASVVEALRKEVLYDRTKVRVLDMSELGLVELTRKKTGRDIGATLLDTCPYCKGSAQTHSGDFVAKKLQAKLKQTFAEDRFTGASVNLNPGIMEKIISSGFLTENCETVWKAKRIYLVPVETMHPNNFQIVPYKSDIISVPSNSKLLF